MDYNEKVFLRPLDADPKLHISPVGTIESRSAFALLDIDETNNEKTGDTDEDLVASGRYKIFPDEYGKIYENLDKKLYGNHIVSLSIPGTRSSVRIPSAINIKSSQTSILPPLHIYKHYFVYKDVDNTGYVLDNLKTEVKKFTRIGTVEEVRKDD